MKQSSFNAFGQKREGFGGRHIPVWLGTVTPYPVGGSLAKAYVKAGLLLPAGTPIQLKDRVITPALVYTVKAYASEVLTIDPSEHPGFTPGKDMYVRLVGDTFPADDGVKVTDAAANAATPSRCATTPRRNWTCGPATPSPCCTHWAAGGGAHMRMVAAAGCLRAIWT